ncbi:MAG: hypothetical protein ACTSU9_08540, partial [Promethearchaeota archaeon]
EVPVAETPAAEQTGSPESKTGGTPPVPLKTLVSNKKLRVEIKPVRIMKIASKKQEKNITPLQVAPTASVLGKEKKELSTVDEAIEDVYKEVQAAITGNVPVKVDSTPKRREIKETKPFLVPKPVKISVPDIGGFDLESELSQPGLEEKNPSHETTPADQDAMTEKPILIKTMGKPPASAGMVPVKISLIKPGSPQQDAKDPPSSRFDPAGDGEYITPAPVTEEDIEFDPPGWLGSGSPSRGEAKAAKVTKVTKAIKVPKESADDSNSPGETGSFPFSQSMFIEGGAGDTGDQAGKEEKQQGFIGFGPGIQPEKYEEKASEIGAEKIVFTSSSNVKRKDNQGTSTSTSEDTGSMSFFTGMLQDRIKEQKDAPSKSPVLLFQSPEQPTTGIDAGDGKGKGSEDGGWDGGGQRESKRVKPIGSDVDLENLPETRDGILQSLIALEGKRFSLERAKKDIKDELENGIINQKEYEKRLLRLKNELDEIVDKINVLREKIKKIKK